MMRRGHLLSVAFVVAMGVMIVGGGACKRKGATADQVLVVANNSEPYYIDPQLATETSSDPILNNVFVGLTEYDPRDLRPVPSAAERWELSGDGKVYTFYLRKDMKWSDGTPLTAHDFVYSWQRLVTPETASEYAYIGYYLKNAKAIGEGKIKDLSQLGVKAIDDFTLRVELENPTPFFPALAAFYSYRPSPRQAVEKHGNRWVRPENMICSGPFKVTAWTPQKELVMEPNPFYWDAQKVKLKQVKLLPIEDQETALKKYLAGEVQVVRDLPPVKIPELKKRFDYRLQTEWATYYFEINVTRPALGDKRVRQALAKAIDRKQITSVLQMGHVPSASMVPSGFPGYTPAKGHEFDPAAGKKLLGEAGFADPKTFPKVTLYYNTNALHKIICEMVQSMWKNNLGIQVELLNQEFKVLLNTRRTKQHDIARAGWYGDYYDPHTFLDLYMSYSGNNNSGWANPEYDGLVEAAAREVDPKKRLQMFARAEALFLEEAPVIPIFMYGKPQVWDTRLRGYYSNARDIHPLKDVYFEMK